MKFAVDAQLPRRLCRLLEKYGHETLHTLDLPARNRTPDRDLTGLADREGAVLVSKDTDFVNSRIRHGKPSKLLLVSTGNIGNDELIAVFEASLNRLTEAFTTFSYVELTREFVIVHE